MGAEEARKEERKRKQDRKVKEKGVGLWQRARRFVSLAAVLLTVRVPASAEEILVHYHRPEGDYTGWTLWTWNPASGTSREITPAGTDGYGLVFRLDKNDYGSNVDRIGLLPKYGDWKAKDDPDRYWTPSLGRNVFILSADKNLYSSPPDTRPRILRALLDKVNEVRVVLSKSIDRSYVRKGTVSVRLPDRSAVPVVEAVPAPGQGLKVRTILVRLGQEIDPESVAGIVVSFGAYRPAPLIPGAVVDSYRYDGELGALYSPEKTIFRTFSPTSAGVSVVIYEGPTGPPRDVVPMKRIGQGIWEAIVEGNLLDKYYKYRVKYPDAEYEVIDPYSHCNTAHNGRGMIIDDNTPVSPAPRFGIADAVIYEIHIRDFTIDPKSGIQHRGKYLGLTEEGTRLEGNPEISTGLDHIKELGVNTVQIMPFQDFDNDEASEAYNWGYMPFHFNSPDGWYATKRDDASRVREAKKMIDAFHRNGIKVVMDVVYNHTAEGNPEVRMSFNGLAPNYYYRVKDDGSYWNGSGTGNEFRTEAPMARKFIVDSMKYWVRKYDVDGFRFDLMGLIDLETLETIVRELRKIKPEIMIYGEPWAGGSTPVKVTSKGDQRGKGFAVFNDHFRDALKGGTFNTEPGFIQDGRDVEKVKKGILGSIDDFTDAPTETINYVAAHDNHTLWDRILLTTRNWTQVTKKDREQMDKLAAVAILTAQGIPFLHGGQDLLRTKDGEENSYNKPDRINMIHWEWKKKHREVFEYYRGLIALRRAHPLFRKTTADAVRRGVFFLDDDLELRVPPRAIGFVVNRGEAQDEWENVLVLMNASATSARFEIPASHWIPVANGEKAGVTPLGPPVTRSEVILPPRSSAIFYNTDPEFYQRVLLPHVAARLPHEVKLTVSAPTARRVTVAGEFNGWDMNALPMKKRPDGMWEIVLSLSRGRYEYKFVADGSWDALNKNNRILNVE